MRHVGDGTIRSFFIPLETKEVALSWQPQLGVSVSPETTILFHSPNLILYVWLFDIIAVVILFYCKFLLFENFTRL